MVKDLSSAVQGFKQRFRYLPGDFPIDAASPEGFQMSAPHAGLVEAGQVTAMAKSQAMNQRARQT